jgi:HEAT repeat protein
VSGTRPIPAAVERRRAVAIAGHRGDEGAVRAALHDVDASVRATAVGALARLGALSTDDADAAMADADPVVRRRAAEEVGRAGLLSAGPAVVALLADADVAVVEAACQALGELDPPAPGSVDRLAALATGHDDVLVREAAVAALGSIGDDAGRAAVLAATTDVATVRRRAVLALAAFDGPEVEEALARLATDRDRQTRQAAEDLLHGWGTADPDELGVATRRQSE